MNKSFESLTLMDDFVFGQVLMDEELCKKLLETILNVKIRKLDYIKAQESFIPPIFDAKSIRLDVYVEDDQNTIYDLDVQTTDKKNLGKRLRFYQSLMDVRALEKGADYKNLKKSFVIFICNYDPFGSEKYMYTFHNYCTEDQTIMLDDDATKIIINSKGTKGAIRDDLKAVLQYLEDGVISSDYTKALDAAVISLKADEKVRRAYMIYEQSLADREELGKKIGKEIGQHMKDVRLVRENMETRSIESLSSLFLISVADCEKVIAAIQAHPDWNDEQIALDVQWDDQQG